MSNEIEQLARRAVACPAWRYFRVTFRSARMGPRPRNRTRLVKRAARICDRNQLFLAAVWPMVRFSPSYP